jgi:hypothetical protein
MSVDCARGDLRNRYRACRRRRMVCELLTCCTNRSGGRRPAGARQSQLAVPLFSLDRFPGNGAPTLTRPGTRPRDGPRYYWRPLHTRMPAQQAPKGSPCPPNARQYQTGQVQEGEIKPRRATYGDGIAIRLALIGAAPAFEFRSLLPRPASPVIGVDRK